MMEGNTPSQWHRPWSACLSDCQFVRPSVRPSVRLSFCHSVNLLARAATPPPSFLPSQPRLSFPSQARRQRSQSAPLRSFDFVKALRSTLDASVTRGRRRERERERERDMWRRCNWLHYGHRPTKRSPYHELDQIMGLRLGWGRLGKCLSEWMQAEQADRRTRKVEGLKPQVMTD